MKPLDLIWVDTDKSVDPTRKKIRSRLRPREYKTKKQGKIYRALPASQLFSALPPVEAVKVLVSIMMSVSLWNKKEPFFPQKIVRSMAKTKLADSSRACTELKMLPTSGNLIM